LLAYNVALKKDGADAGEVKLLLEKDIGNFTPKRISALKRISAKTQPKMGRNIHS
jgi:hypothetical protein